MFPKAAPSAQAFENIVSVSELEKLAGQLIGQGRLAVGKGGSLYVPE